MGVGGTFLRKFQKKLKNFSRNQKKDKNLCLCERIML